MKNQRQSAAPKPPKSAKPIDGQTIKSAIKNESNNEITRSARRPIVDKQTIDKRPLVRETTQRPTTASRPLTARAAPPRAVSRRVLREEKQTNNVLEMATNMTRPQTAVKQVLVSNLIKESNDSVDDDSDDSLVDDKVSKRTMTANKDAQHKDDISKLDDEADLFVNRNQLLNKDDIDDPEKGSLVKKLIKSKQDLEGGVENQQVSSASLVRSNRDIDRLKEHIQALTKLANPLSRLLDNLQEDIDLMLLEERNWIEEQQRNEQQLIVLREQIDEELKNVNLQISKLDDQIQQEQDAILVTNVNLLTNQARLEDIVRRMIEN